MWERIVWGVMALIAFYLGRDNREVINTQRYALEDLMGRVEANNAELLNLVNEIEVLIKKGESH